MRVLVTGSREWTSKKLITHELTKIGLGPDFTLVYGACPRGADTIAAKVAKELGWTLEPHPANWKKYGRAAGFQRNKEMVNSKPDLCLAFIINNSQGASHTSDLSVKASIKTVIFHKKKKSTKVKTKVRSPRIGL